MESESPLQPPSSSLRALASLLLCSLFPPPASSDDCRFSDRSRRILLRDFAAREFNAFLWVSLIAVTALLSARLLKLVRLWRSGGRIAGPPCTSFYSHFELLSRGSLAEVLSDSHKNYGSVVRLWLSPTKLLVSIKDPKLIKDMLFKAIDKLPSTGKAFNLAFGRSNLFASSFSEVQKIRETLNTDLSERLSERRNVILEKAFDYIVERIHRSMAEGSVDSKTVSQHMAFTILGTTLFGGDFLAFSNANDYEKLIMKISEEASFWASYNVTPFWKREFWKYRRLCADLNNLTRLIIQQRKEKCNLFRSVDQDRFDGTKTEGCLDEIEDSFGNIIGMMFHGCLTTTGLINNILMRVVQHPEIQDKIYDEIFKAQRDSTAPVEQSIDKMPLLLATVYEASRLLQATPLLQRCSPKHDLFLENGVVIPAEAAIVVPVQLMHNDYFSWGSDACEFNPYRFLSHSTKKPDLVLNTPLPEEATDLEKNSFVLNDPNDHVAYLAFGSGVRACVGQNFVIQGVAGLFATLLKHFKIKLQAEADNNRKPKLNNFRLEPKLDFLKRNN